MDDSVKKTPLYDIHCAAGGKMVDFAGWALPVQFTGVIEEHLNTRQRASLFDTCHMGELMLSGAGASAFLQSLITNDMDLLKPGSCFYTLLCNEEGKSLDDCFVYHLEEELFMVVCNASNIEKLVHWMNSKLSGHDARLEDRSPGMGKIDLQGPAALPILERMIDQDCSEEAWPRFTLRRVILEDLDLWISRTGYTGEDGFEFYMDSHHAPALWNRLMEAGKKQGLAPAGLGARDTLRLESCYSLYGHELDEETTPVESGLGWVVRNSEAPFFGKEILLKQKKEGVPRRMVAFEMTERAIPRQGYSLEISLDDGSTKEAGIVTSGGYSPTLEKNIGLGFIQKEFAQPGTAILVNVRGRTKKAVVVKRPFYNFKGQ